MASEADTIKNNPSERLGGLHSMDGTSAVIVPALQGEDYRRCIPARAERAPDGIASGIVDFNIGAGLGNTGAGLSIRDATSVGASVLCPRSRGIRRSEVSPAVTLISSSQCLLGLLVPCFWVFSHSGCAQWGAMTIVES